MFKLDATTIICVMCFCAVPLLASPILWMWLWGNSRRKAVVMRHMTCDAMVLYCKAYLSPNMAHFAEWRNAKEDKEKFKARVVASEQVDQHYEREFGLVAMLLPSLSLLLTSALGFYSIAFWSTKRLAYSPLEMDVAVVAIAAFLGGYTWALSSLYERAWQNNLRPRDIAWAAFRLMIATPLGLAIVWFMVGVLDLKNLPLATGVAYLLGTFPTVSLMEFGQLLVRRFIQIPGVSDQQVSELQKLASIDAFAANALKEYGITNPEQLATCDPVHLCWSTGLSFDYVVICVLDAVAWSYIGDERKFAAAASLGVRGAYDLANLDLDLELDDKDPDYKDACEVVKSLSGILGSNEGGVKNLIWNVAHDPLVTFLMEVWWEDED